MRIGIATHNYPPHIGGLEVLVRELAVQFGARHDVVVVTTAWDGQSGVSNEDGVTVHRLPAWHGTETRGVPYAMPLGPGVARAFEVLRSCAVVHAHGSLYATTVLAQAARRRSTPFFVTEHVGFVPYPSGIVNATQRLAWSTVGRYVIRHSAGVITYNSRVRDQLTARFPRDRVLFIPNGVDAVKFQPACAARRMDARTRLGLPPDAVLALSVGRDAGKKNIDQLVGLPHDGYRLMVSGAERVLPADVIDLGVRPHDLMPDLFAAADFLIHAAEGEGFPVAVQEAMASGLPVALLWDPGYAGSVDSSAVLAVDSVSALAQGACDLARDEHLRQALSARARQYALEHWNWNTTVDRHLALFADALGRH